MIKHYSFIAFFIFLLSSFNAFGNKPDEENTKPSEDPTALVQAIIQWGTHVPGAVIYTPNGEVLAPNSPQVFATLFHSPHLRNVIESLTPHERRAFWRALAELLTPNQINRLRRILPMDPSSEALTKELINIPQETESFIDKATQVLWALFCLYESMRYGSSIPGPMRSRL